LSRAGFSPLRSENPAAHLTVRLVKEIIVWLNRK
jgi:hypothetical protein